MSLHGESSHLDTVVSSRITDVYWVQLRQGADLYEAIHDTAVKYDIYTGLVLNVVGGLSRARLSTPGNPKVIEAQPGIVEFEGTMEASGVGFIGHNLDTFESTQSGIVDRAGEPNIHVHLTVGQMGMTHMGHLIEGCIVRSLTAKSHFTIVMAKTEGAALEMRLSEETFANYPGGVPVHHLRAT